MTREKSFMPNMIFGYCFTQSQYADLRKSINSSKVIDNVKSGYAPGSSPDGVLCSFPASPLAFHGTPTLNSVVFSKGLWTALMDNPMLKSAMTSHSHYGTVDHELQPEVSLQRVGNRVNSLEFGPKDLIIGDVDVLDTPSGLLVYSLCKSGRVGISTRGHGEVKPINNGLQQVVEDTYNHVSFDFVALPAVPTATVSLLNSVKEYPTQDLVVEELRKMVSSALDKWSDDPILLGIDKIVNSGKTTYSIPSTVKAEPKAKPIDAKAVSTALVNHAKRFNG
jgi:hypothetical protein